MKITVFGLWHLGCVTAACCAKHFDVTGLDFNELTVSNLRKGAPPLLEPGLEELIRAGMQAGRLRFSSDPAHACKDCDVVWVTHDTPVTEDDQSDVHLVLSDLRRALRFLSSGTLVVISAQIPVGTCALLEKEFPGLDFACSPENLRLGKAIDAFEHAGRIVVGIRNDAKRPLLETLFKPFTSQLVFMRTESAEMVKHALNSFLALSISYINEVARVCEKVGADAKEVAIGLKSEPRIGPKAYLSPGGPFAGGTLARDVVSLVNVAAKNNEALSLIPAIKRSNDLHRNWAFQRLELRLGELQGRTIAVFGLTYTPGTNTLRRSWAVELCRKLAAAGASVNAFDPGVKDLSGEPESIRLLTRAEEALQESDAAVICTEWPQFRDISWQKLITTMHRPLVLDPNRFLENELKNLPGVEHLSVGHSI